jgi:hypothetical protein
MNSDAERESKIDALLLSLNEWEQKYGIQHSRDPTLKSSGEANARIAQLKRELDELGASYHWDGVKYVLDKNVSRPE